MLKDLLVLQSKYLTSTKEEITVMILNKREKKALKNLDVSTKSEAISYLQHIIFRLEKSLERKQRYIDELTEFIEKTQKSNIIVRPESIKVPHEKYQRYLDLLTSVEIYATNLIGDLQKHSLSYYNFRRAISNGNLKGNPVFSLDPLEEDMIKILEAFRDSRNFQSHVPQSLATVENKLINDGHFAPPSINPIIIFDYEYCTLSFIVDLKRENLNSLEGQKIVYEQILKDYSQLVGVDQVQVKHQPSSSVKDVNYLEPVRISSKI